MKISQGVGLGVLDSSLAITASNKKNNQMAGKDASMRPGEHVACTDRCREN